MRSRFGAQQVWQSSIRSCSWPPAGSTGTRFGSPQRMQVKLTASQRADGRALAGSGRRLRLAATARRTISLVGSMCPLPRSAATDLGLRKALQASSGGAGAGRAAIAQPKIQTRVRFPDVPRSRAQRTSGAATALLALALRAAARTRRRAAPAGLSPGRGSPARHTSSHAGRATTPRGRQRTWTSPAAFTRRIATRGTCAPRAPRGFLR